MAYILVCTVALVAAGLTFFSGFGLGTILLPAFLVFFPVTVAVAATAVVHLANNLFKLYLVGRDASWRYVLQFGVPAILAAAVGAWLLSQLGDLEPIIVYSIGSSFHRITPIGLVIGILMIGFAALELWPRFDELAFNPRYLPLGGAISGFFGGLSGHQGALRAAFLVRLGLSRDAFIGTSVVCAVIVDVARLVVYAEQWRGLQEENIAGLVAAGCVAAFVGSYLGVKLVRKVTMKTIRWVVGVMLMVLGAVLAGGLIPGK